MAWIIPLLGGDFLIYLLSLGENGNMPQAAKIEEQFHCSFPGSVWEHACYAGSGLQPEPKHFGSIEDD